MEIATQVKGSWEKQPPSPASSDMGEWECCCGSGRSFREGCYTPEINVFSDSELWWASPPSAGIHPDFPLPSPCHTAIRDLDVSSPPEHPPVWDLCPPPAGRGGNAAYVRAFM